MCRNDLHITIECPPVEEGQPDVCDLVAQFVADLQSSVHTKLWFQLDQVEDKL